MILILKDKLNPLRQPVYEYSFTWEQLAIFLTALTQILNKDEYAVEIKGEMKTIGELYPYNHIHPKAPICRKCGERISYQAEIKLCEDCKDEIREEAAWIDFEEEQKEFWNKFNKGE